MLFESFYTQQPDNNQAAVNKLESYHQRNYSLVLWVLLLGLGAFFVWASVFKINQVARASSEVIASSRVQIIQSVDGGVLENLNVREGDRVERGQILASLDQTRIGAEVNEVDARLSALKAKATRLRAEVTDSNSLVFTDDILRFPETVKVERALFKQRRHGLQEELRTLQVAVRLAQEDSDLIANLQSSGDVNRQEGIRAERALNDAEAQLINSRNKYLEQASSDLARAEDEIAQNEQILTQRKQQLADSVFIAKMSGIVKNVRVTTVGGVLGRGEELMQIIPLDDELIIEAKVSPVDIAYIHTGLEAMVRFDPFDYTVFGSVIGEVVYVSADTLKEESGRGEEIYYRVHILAPTNPAITTSGRELDILPGMTAQIDIRTGERTLLEFLLKPLRKTLSESFGER